MVDRGVEVEERPIVRTGGRSGRRQEWAGEEGGHVEAGEGELHRLLQLQRVRVDVDEPGDNRILN